MLERCAQLRAAPMNPAADGAELDAERFGDLLVRQALDVAQHDRRAVLGWQVGERSGDVVIEMTSVERLRRSRLRALEPRRGLLPQALEPDSLSPAREVKEQVRGDAVQPALEGSGCIAGQRPEYPTKAPWGGAVGGGIVPGRAMGEPVYPGRVLLDAIFPARRRPLGSRILAKLVHRLSLHQPSFASPAKLPRASAICLR